MILDKLRIFMLVRCGRNQAHFGIKLGSLALMSFRLLHSRTTFQMLIDASDTQPA